MRGRVRPRLPLGRFVVVVAAVAAALAAGPVAAAHAADRAKSAGPTARSAIGAASTLSSAQLAQDATLLNGALAAAYPRTFGGLTTSTRGITVYTTRTDAGIAAVVDRYVPADAVLYAHSAHTLGALDSIHRRLVASFMALLDAGIDVVGFAPDVAASTEEIEVVGPTPAQVAWLEARFPRQPITVQSVGLAPLPSGFVARVQTEPHASVPRGLAPVLGSLAIVFASLSVAALFTLRRRQRRADAPVTGIPAELGFGAEAEPALAAA